MVKEFPKTRISPPVIKKFFVILIPIFVLFAAFVTFLLAQRQQDLRSRASSENASKANLPRRDALGDYASGELLILFKDGVKEGDKQKALSRYSATVLEELPKINVLRIKVNERALPKILNALRNNPVIEFAETHDSVLPSLIPNDPNYSRQWFHPNILTPDAWDITTSNGIIAAVCDTGVQPDHPDLQPILRGDLGWNAVDGSSNWSNVASHGTLVSGALAAVVNNSTGVAGVSYGAQIIPIRISNDLDGMAYVSDAAKCIQYAADKNARVINLSYRMAHSSTIESSAKYALSRGGLTFVAAGNDGVLQNWTNHPSFLSIVASSTDNLRTSWSNYGSFVDLAAPGNNVWTTKVTSTYGGASGTSLASPVAAGVGALVFAANSSLTANQVINILFSTAKDVGEAGYDIYHGWGRVDAKAAVIAARSGSSAPPPDTTPPVVAITSPQNGATVSGSVTIQTTVTDNIGVSKVEFYVDNQIASSDLTSPFTFSWNTTTFSNGSHTITAKAIDTSNNFSSTSITLNVNNPLDTTPPTVSITQPSNGQSVLGNISVTISASDNIGVVEVDLLVNNVFYATDTTSPYSFTVDTTEFVNGVYSLTARAYDAAGNESSSSPVSITINNPTPDTTPPITSITSPVNGAVVAGGITVAANASDNVGVSKVEFYLDGVLKAIDTTSSYTYFWDTNQVLNGEHNLQTKAYDSSGNVGTSQLVNVTVQNIAPTPTPTLEPNDTIAPVVAITNPINGTLVKGNVKIAANASDNVGVIKIEIYIDGALKSSSGGSSISTSWNVNSRNVAPGNHTIEARAYDAAGNVGRTSITVTK